MNIFVSGEAGAGKSFCCKYLETKYGFKTIKLAETVYEIAQKYFGMTGKDRQMLIDIGTTVGRKMVDENIWIDMFAKKADTITQYANFKGLKLNLCCDDVRFYNEMEMLKSRGWTGVYLKCPKKVRLSRLQNRDGDTQEKTLKHESERQVKTFKKELIQIDASGSLDDMYDQLDQIVEEYQNA